MRIDVSSIRDVKGATVEVDIREPIGRVNAGFGELAPRRPAEVRARVTNTGHGSMLVYGHARVELEARCDRCLKPFMLEAQADFEQEYRRGREDRQREAAPPEAGQDDGHACEFYGDVIDISQQVIESLVLSLPIKMLCRNDCRGLCPDCGKDLNEGPCSCRRDGGDVRLAGLARMLRDTDSENA